MSKSKKKLEENKKKYNESIKKKPEKKVTFDDEDDSEEEDQPLIKTPVKDELKKMMKMKKESIEDACISCDRDIYIWDEHYSLCLTCFQSKGILRRSDLVQTLKTLEKEINQLTLENNMLREKAKSVNI